MSQKINKTPFAYKYVNKTIWRRDFFYSKPRSKAELIHDILTNIANSKAIVIEPIFNLENESYWNKLYIEALHEIFLFFGNSPSENTVQLFSPNIEYIESKRYKDGKLYVRENFFHTDAITKYSDSQIHLMYTIRPSKSGGQNVFVPADLVAELLFQREPELAEELLKLKVYYKGKEESLPVLSKTSSGYLVSWNYKKLDANRNNVNQIILDKLHHFLETTDWEFGASSAPIMPGSAVVWWDSTFLHRRVDEVWGAKARKVAASTINVPETPFSPRSDVSPLKRDHDLDLFSIVDHILDNILPFRQDKPFVIGIDGPNTAGKTTLAHALSNALCRLEFRSAVISGDYFHTPEEVRYSYPSPRAFRSFYFDYTPITEFLSAVGLEKGDAVLFGVDRFTGKKELICDNRSIPLDVVVIEGMFLQDTSLKPYFDFVCYLHTTGITMLTSGIERWRDRHIYQASVERFEDRYILANREYVSNKKPHYKANLIISRDKEKYRLCKAGELHFSWPF